MAQYQLRFFFDYGGDCLWAANDAALRRFGYPLYLPDLGLPDETLAYASEVASQWVRLAEIAHLPENRPLLRRRLDRDAQALLQTFRVQLGPDYELLDESGTDA